MNAEFKAQMAESVRNFRLPRYHEIPDVGLYLEQTTKYNSQYLEPLPDIELTNSMISNYVKKKLIASPVKKQYSRDQIAYLFFIAVGKSVLSINSLQNFIDLQRQTYTPERAYNYFCREMENVIAYTFGLKDQLDAVGDPNPEHPDEKMLLRNTIVTAANKIYLDQCLSAPQLLNKQS